MDSLNLVEEFDILNKIYFWGDVMELEWMGKYRKFVEKMMKFGNTYARTSRGEHNYSTPVKFSASELQVLEYILENEERYENMVEIADAVGISKSALSKNIKKMEEKGLLEKYHTTDNQKNIIVRVSAYGKEVYTLYAKYSFETAFKRMFQILDEIPEEYIGKFTEVMEIAAEMAAADKENGKNVELVKITSLK